MIIRQGDVLLISRDRIPEGARLEVGCILAYGEATGHTHEITEGARIWVNVNVQGKRYLEIFDKKAVLRHQEHGQIELFKEQHSVFEIIRQVEYTPQEVRYVSD